MNAFPTSCDAYVQPRIYVKDGSLDIRAKTGKVVLKVTDSTDFDNQDVASVGLSLTETRQLIAQLQRAVKFAAMYEVQP